LSSYFSKQNTGGAIASRGFSYQDYCALIELFKVVDDDTFKAISCETKDDFTIFMHNKEILYQVKKKQFDIDVINEYLEKNITAKQNFIFTSKDSSKYNGLFDKRKEYEQSLISSRNPIEKQKIKIEIQEIIEKNNIKDSDKYLSSEILIYEESNIDDILFAKAIKWLENQSFKLKNIEDFLDKLRLKISDLKNNRGELNKDDFNKIVHKFKLSNEELIDIKDLNNISKWYTDIDSIVNMKQIFELFSDREKDISSAEDLISIGKYNEALNIYKYIAEREKNNKNIRLLELKVANLYYKIRDYQNTIEICNKYNSKDYLLLKANSLGQIGKYKKALTALNDIAKEERDYIVYYNIAVSHMYLNELEKAIINYKKSLEKNDSFENSYLNLAICQYQLNPLNKDILNNLNKALEHNPTFDNALSQKAEVLRYLGKYSNAKSLFREALSINSSNPISLYGLAMCLFENRKYEDGLIFFNNWLHTYFKEEIKNDIIICDLGYKKTISIAIKPVNDKLEVHIDNNIYIVQSNINKDFIFIGVVGDNDVKYPLVGKRYDRLNDFLDIKKQIIESLKLDANFIRTDNQDIDIVSTPILETIDVDKNVKISIKEEKNIFIDITINNLNIQGFTSKGKGYYNFQDEYHIHNFCQILLENNENNQKFIIETYMRCEIH